MPDVEFRKHQVLYMRCKSSTGELYKTKVYYMKPKATQGFSKVQNLRTGKISVSYTHLTLPTKA